MKLIKPTFRTVTFSTVKAEQECTFEGQRVFKIRTKLGMTPKGKVISIPDNTLVRIKL